MTSDLGYRGVGAVLGSAVLGWTMLLASPVLAEGTVTAAPQPLPVEGDIFAVVPDDVDHDGHIDLVTTNRGRSTAQILYQKAPRQFKAGPAVKVLGFHANEFSRLPGVESRYVLSAEGEGVLKVLLLDGKGSLKEGATYPLDGPYAVTTFSWPGWGLSLAVAPYQGDTLTVLRNFQPDTAQVDKAYELTVPRQSIPGVVTFADVDNDGIAELLYTTRRSRAIWQVNYPKDGKPPEPALIWTAPVGAPRHLAVADLNGDGAVDILLPLESERRIATLLNDGKGHFTPGPELTVPSSAWGPARLAIAEDRDSALLLVADTEQSLMFYRIRKGNPFRYDTVELPIDASLRQLMLRDIDGDGELDVVMVMNVVEDSLRIVYGPLWTDLANKFHAVADSALATKALKGEIKIQDDPSRVVAKVGDQAITVSQVRQFVMESGTGHSLESSSGQIEILRKIIEEALLKKAVARELGATEPLTFEQFSSGMKSLEEKYFPLPEAPDEAVLRAYYETNKEEYGIPEMVQLVQIQFRNDQDRPGGPPARQRAEQALRRLEAGEKFDQVAAALSENPRARGTGPERGFVARNVEPWLRDALRGLQTGQRTGIVESPVGYEILLIRDWRAPVFVEFNVVRTKASNRWRADQQQQARGRYLKTLAERFGVTVMEKEMENANPAKQ
ncbi:MAG: FG-GAP-like repeat-containing protein [Candidatus Contendobacter sp.]|nr:FG-GAP-like repeat-containing protein [Candidatus Contendobacter sp.]MDG4558616.1 FG-GAP-like repeat-containing protein [Candidatus Contendobacter sp.]